MFNSIIEVAVLSTAEVTEKVVREINALLLSQHSEAHQLSREQMLEHMDKSRLAVARQDGHVIAMAVAVTSYVFSHTMVRIHNCVVRKEGYEQQEHSLKMRLIELLTAGITGPLWQKVEIEVSKDDHILQGIVQGLGFKEKSKLTYRRRIKRLKPPQ